MIPNLKFDERKIRYKIPSFYGVFVKREIQDWLAIVDNYWTYVDADPAK